MRVLYVDGEMAIEEMQKRLRKISNGDKDRAQFDNSNLQIITPDAVDGPGESVAGSQSPPRRGAREMPAPGRMFARPVRFVLFHTKKSQPGLSITTGAIRG